MCVGGQFPRCYHVNELGKVALSKQGMAEGRNAAVELMSLLYDSDEKVRYAAYGSLKAVEDRWPDAQVAINDFEMNPRNQNLVLLYKTQQKPN